MHIEQNAPPGASGGHQSLFATVGAMTFAQAYEQVRGRLNDVDARAIMEQSVADAIDFLDDLDAATTDLECDETNPPTTLDKVHCSESEDSEPWLAGSPPSNFSIPLDAEADSSSGVSDDEPSLGAAERHPIAGGSFDYRPERHDQRLWAAGGDADDCEAVDEHGADDDGGEETLGWPERLSQKALGQNTPDGEWSLGSTNARDQTHWSEGRGDDREDEHDGCEDANEDHDGDCDAKRSYRKHV